MFRTELKNWTKGASSPVSEADIAVNDLVEKRLRAATPDYGWLSEESADDESRLGKRLTWIVDPIDGTRTYLAGREDWCVSVALVEDAAPVLAAVFAPCHRRILLRDPRAGHHAATDVPVRAARPAPSSIFPAWPARSRWCERLSPSPDGDHAVSANRIAGAAACAGSPMAAWMRLLPGARAATGILPPRI